MQTGSRESRDQVDSACDSGVGLALSDVGSRTQSFLAQSADTLGYLSPPPHSFTGDDQAPATPGGHVTTRADASHGPHQLSTLLRLFDVDDDGDT